MLITASICLCFNKAASSIFMRLDVMVLWKKEKHLLKYNPSKANLYRYKVVKRKNPSNFPILFNFFIRKEGLKEF